jgi:hypothetical protein
VNEVLTFEEIRDRFDGEWVLIGDPIVNEKGQVLSGTVLAHSKDRDEVYRRGIELRHRNFATLCFVPEPKDMRFVV